MFGGLVVVGFYSFVGGWGGWLFVFIVSQGFFNVVGIRSIYCPKAELGDSVIIVAQYVLDALFLETRFRPMDLF